MTDVEAPFAPITKIAPDEDACWMNIDPAILNDPARLNRLRLMLCAAYEGVEIRRNTGGAPGSADLVMYADKYIGNLSMLTLASINRRLAELPKQPVRLLHSGPKVMQWLLVVDFRVQRQHLDELRRIDGIVNAVVTPDNLYDGRLVELFIPEDPYLDDDYVPDGEEDDETARKKDDGPLPFVIRPEDLRKKIEAALSFALTPNA